MFVADLHNDVLQRAIIGEDISIRTENGHSDLIRLKESCIDLEVFVVWTTNKKSKASHFVKAKEFFSKLEFLEKNNSYIKITKNLEEINNAKTNNFLAILDAGAYGAVMSSNYNSRGIPAEILVNQNNFSIIHQEEKISEIIKRDSIPDWL